MAQSTNSAASLCIAQDIIMSISQSGRLHSSEWLVKFKPNINNRTSRLAKRLLMRMSDEDKPRFGETVYTRTDSMEAPDISSGPTLARVKSLDVDVSDRSSKVEDVQLMVHLNDHELVDGNGCSLMILNDSYRCVFADNGSYTPSRADLFRISQYLNLPSHNCPSVTNNLVFACQFHSSNISMTTDCQCFVYSWNHKFAVFDIDGTITKSDVLGIVDSSVGGGYFDHIHAGICSLVHQLSISSQHYGVVYLTARPITWAAFTKKFIRSLSQDNIALPNGPIITNNERVVRAFVREIAHKSGELKLDILGKIRCLFCLASQVTCSLDDEDEVQSTPMGPSSFTPFVIGFGNRETDAWAYTNVGVDSGCIFLINPSSTIMVWSRSEKRSNRLEDFGAIGEFNSYHDPRLLAYLTDRGVLSHCSNRQSHSLSDSEYDRPRNATISGFEFANSK